MGEGTFIISNQADVTTRNGQATASMTVQAGTLVLDYTTNNNSKLSDTAALVLGGSRLGGTLELRGTGASNHIEIVSSVTLAAGDNQIVRSSGNAILRMNGISRQAGATINFSGDDIASTDTANVVGILGSWATVGGTTWATKSTFDELGCHRHRYDGPPHPRPRGRALHREQRQQ